jgi:dihydroorotate dehydrogenase
MYQEVILPFLTAASGGDPEQAHIITKRMIGVIQKSPVLLSLIESFYRVSPSPKPAVIAGVNFPNRIGLAAGLDKQGEMLLLLQAIGFGFAEIGTILPRPQTGNPRPRVFRIPEHSAICNRMGFNSDGVDVVASRLSAVRPRIRIPIGVSVSRNKSTPDNEVAADCIATLERTYAVADYYTVNVSSPNTPNLRDAQKEEIIGVLVQEVVAAGRRSATSRRRPEVPIFAKFSPDLPDDEFLLSINAAEKNGVSGFVFSNTTMRPPEVGWDSEEMRQRDIIGGLSGPFLFERTLSRVCLARSRTRLPIIACGGITDATRAKVLRQAGADLFQIYTGFIYQGPGLVKRLVPAV